MKNKSHTTIREGTTKRVNCHKTAFFLFCIEKDTRGGAKYAPFACVPVVYPSGLEPELDGVGGHNVIQLHYGYIKQAVFVRFSALL